MDGGWEWCHFVDHVVVGCLCTGVVRWSSITRSAQLTSPCEVCGPPRHQRSVLGVRLLHPLSVQHPLRPHPPRVARGPTALLDASGVHLPGQWPQHHRQRAPRSVGGTLTPRTTVCMARPHYSNANRLIGLHKRMLLARYCLQYVSMYVRTVNVGGAGHQWRNERECRGAY